MSEDSIASSKQTMSQTNGNDTNSDFECTSNNAEASNEVIDTGSEFDDLYSHEEDNSEHHDDDDDDDDESGHDENSSSTEYPTRKTGQDQSDIQRDVSTEESDGNMSEEQDEEEQVQIEEGKDGEENKEAEVEEKTEKSDSSSSSDSESTSESEGEEEENGNEGSEEENDNEEYLKNVDFNLIEKQIKYLVDSDM